MKNYTIGDIEDFDENVFNEIRNKSGEQYDELKDDEFSIDTNIDKCIEILNQKMKAVKPKPKPAPKPTPKADELKQETKPEIKQEEAKRVKCECGADILATNMDKHKATKTHIKAMEKLAQTI